MKTVRRIGVFETNSSSSHSLMLCSKDEAEKMKKNKRKRYGFLTDIDDKFLMACGCCYEMFPEEKDRIKYASEADKARREEISARLKSGRNVTLTVDDVTYETALSFLTAVYCDITGKDKDATLAETDGINKSGRACHMKFLYEGSLTDPKSDYSAIYYMFDGDVGEIERHIRRYFGNDNVLCYR